MPRNTTIPRKAFFGAMNFTPEEIYAFVNGAMLTGGLLVIGHFFPLPGHQNGHLPKTVLNLICRYVYGVASIWMGVLVWLGLLGQAQIALGILGICIAGGLAVVLSYWWDDYREAKEQREKLADDARDINGKL